MPSATIGPRLQKQQNIRHSGAFATSLERQKATCRCTPCTDVVNLRKNGPQCGSRSESIGKRRDDLVPRSAGTQLALQRPVPRDVPVEAKQIVPAIAVALADHMIDMGISANAGYTDFVQYHAAGNIAKSVFQLHGVDTAGRVILKKRLPRN